MTTEIEKNTKDSPLTNIGSKIRGHTIKGDIIIIHTSNTMYKTACILSLLARSLFLSLTVRPSVRIYVDQSRKLVR